MAGVSGWNPFDVSLNLEANVSNVRRTGSTTFTCDISVAWKVYWSGNKTNYGMKVSAGGKTIGIPYYDGSKNSSGSGTLSGCSFSISGNNTTSANITVKFTNYKDDVKSKPSASKDVTVSVTGIPIWYTNGSEPTCSISQTAGSNVITFSGTLGRNGTNNSMTSAKLYYYITGVNTSGNTEVALTATSGGSYTHSVTLGSAQSSYAVAAYTSCYYEKNSTWSGQTTRTCYYYSSVSAGDVTITDNGNNTFTITGRNGTAGSNNPIVSSVLQWTIKDTVKNVWYSTDPNRPDIYPRETFTGNSISRTYNMANYAGADTSATREVAATVVVKGQYGEDVYPAYPRGWYKYLDVKQYLAPTKPSWAPTISTNSFTGNRLTTRKHWVYSWGSSTARGCSGLSGYSVAVVKNGARIRGLYVPSGKPTYLKKGSGNNEWVDMTYTEGGVVNFDPVDLGFNAGDSVYITVWGYTKNGKNESLYSDAVISDTKIVEKSGIVYTKDSTSWKTGVVQVRNNKGSWTEAEAVKVWTGSKWKDSI